MDKFARRYNEKPFQTLGDPALIRMLTATVRFVNDMAAKKEPRWLSLLGGCGIGKTRLARAIWKWYSNSWGLSHPLNATEDTGSFEDWRKVAAMLRAQEANKYIQDMAEGRMLVLDDIGCVADSTGFITSELSNLLGRRVGKWTVITCNMGLQGIAEKLDMRIASRMMRNESDLVEADTIDWELRLEARL